MLAILLAALLATVRRILTLLISVSKSAICFSTDAKPVFASFSIARVSAVFVFWRSPWAIAFFISVRNSWSFLSFAPLCIKNCVCSNCALGLMMLKSIVSSARIWSLRTVSGAGPACRFNLAWMLRMVASAAALAASRALIVFSRPTCTSNTPR